MHDAEERQLLTCRVTDPPLHLFASDLAFKPNPTTVRFARAVRITPGSTVFDIGTGIGPLAIKAGLEGAARVVAVDPVPLHCELARANINRYGLQDRVEVHQGRFFEPFAPGGVAAGLKADTIIGDVSGIADRVARALGWYPTDVPTGGDDGAGPILGLLAQAGHYLRPGGTLVFPIATDLSDADRILAAANQAFESVSNPFDKPYFEFPLSKTEIEAIGDAYHDAGGPPPYIRIQSPSHRPYWRGQILTARGPRVIATAANRLALAG